MSNFKKNAKKKNNSILIAVFIFLSLIYLFSTIFNNNTALLNIDLEDFNILLTIIMSIVGLIIIIKIIIEYKVTYIKKYINYKKSKYNKEFKNICKELNIQIDEENTSLITLDDLKYDKSVKGHVANGIKVKMLFCGNYNDVEIKLYDLITYLKNDKGEEFVFFKGVYLTLLATKDHKININKLLKSDKGIYNINAYNERYVGISVDSKMSFKYFSIDDSNEEKFIKSERNNFKKLIHFIDYLYDI